MGSEPRRYRVNEIYRTLQGEGVRYGVPHVFVRFADCNLTCGFCDTEFASGREMAGAEILAEALRLAELTPEAPPLHVEGARRPPDRGPARRPLRRVLFCGGEPLLQLDPELIELFKAESDPWFVAVETNGTRPVPEGVDWIACSPKVAEHAIKLTRAHELKYVRGVGQGIPRPAIPADHYLISPMFEGDRVSPETLEWCVRLVQENPGWRLTIQHHKAAFGGMR